MLRTRFREKHGRVWDNRSTMIWQNAFRWAKAQSNGGRILEHAGLQQPAASYSRHHENLELMLAGRMRELADAIEFHPHGFKSTEISCKIQTRLCICRGDLHDTVPFAWPA